MLYSGSGGSTGNNVVCWRARELRGEVEKVERWPNGNGKRVERGALHVALQWRTAKQKRGA